MSLIKRAIVANRKKVLPAGTSAVRIMFHEVERAAAVRFVFDLPVVPRVVGVPFRAAKHSYLDMTEFRRGLYGATCEPFAKWSGHWKVRMQLCDLLIARS
jgi:hypothetical protein